MDEGGADEDTSYRQPSDFSPALSLLISKKVTTTTNNNNNTDECMSCESLKRMLYLRDKTIMKLAEDRDAVKIKLTKAMNMNIMLSRQLMKYQHHTAAVGSSTALHSSPPQRSSPKTPNEVNNNNNNNNRQQPTQTDEIRHELVELRKKCRELDDIKTHLRQYLSALKTIFVDLGQMGDEEKIEDVDDVSLSEIDDNDNIISTNNKTSVSKNVGEADTIDINKEVGDDEDDEEEEISIKVNGSNTEPATITTTTPGSSTDEKVPKRAEVAATLSTFDIWYNS